MDIRVRKSKKIQGEIEVPGDKSISHRAMMLGSLSHGITEVKNFLMGADCLSTIECFRAMGAQFEQTGETSVIVKGMGLKGLNEPGDVLNVGNSGTTIRLMMGILAGQPFFSTVTGDDSIRKRPMARVAAPLREMGALIDGREAGNLAPITVRGGNLKPIEFVSPVASAQVKSAVILAGLYASGVTTIKEPQKSRDHTERMLVYLGAQICVNESTVQVTGGAELVGRPIEVPGDISSAAFFMVAAAILPDSLIRINRVGLNPTRTGIIDVLLNMGADLQITNEGEVNGEPIGDIIVKGGNKLRGVVIEGSLIPRLIDEIPIIAVAAAAAEGETTIRDAAELKVKETNRIATVAGELAKLGVEITQTDDGMIISGGSSLTGAICESHGDHRIAMTAAIAGLAADGETMVSNAGCVNVSFPGFSNLLGKLVV
ncbi:MAG TPA: 3-phosphoshikimate 1-carboxyvinyltransferase [Desulfobacteria bacterium]|nr:3-phosphoshikimate 1-carboxyvinyltransferase [Desulfobacteria bacterium]